MEGSTIVDEYVNKDRSREIQVYKKVGVGVVMTPDICVYINTELAGNFDVYAGDKVIPDVDDDESPEVEP